MQPKRVRLACLVLLIVLPATPPWIVAGSRAHADTAVPTDTAIVATPEATEAPPTVLPTAEEPPPTVAQEESTPIVTSPPPAVVLEPSPAATVRTEPQTIPRHVKPETPPTPTSVVIPAVTAPPSAPLPSPAELRLNARLRWGTRIPPQVRRWAFLIVPAARKYHLDPTLIAAVMTMESNGDPLALSSADARGLMQILHGPWDPKKNVYRGARMLAELLSEFHSTKLALAAYNAGPNAVVDYAGVPPYRETRDYVIIVEYLYELYNHHRLGEHRRALFRSTLKDLQRFADQRKKIPVLARAGQVAVDLGLGCHRAGPACGRIDWGEPLESVQPTKPAPLFPTLDPFWPVGGAPDPLQRVDPNVIRGG